MPDFSGLFNFEIPEVSDAVFFRFFKDAFQLIATWFGSMFQSETWDAIWQRFVEWFGWIYLVDPKA